MSIFGSQEKKENLEDTFTFPLSSNTNSHHSFISDDLEINGNITGKDYIDFNGKITGTLRSNKIDIRENGIVNGEIHAENIIVAGEVDGEIKADDLYIRSTAKIKGVIRYKNIDIQAGAIITAELIKTI